MTDAIPLDQLGAQGDDGKRRDRWGRLLVVPPEGGDPVGYTRVTTVAKALDEGGGLMPWKATMASVGLMVRPGLRAKWEALISAHAGDPWYASVESKAACKRLVEECAEAGGSTNRRDQGTALHALTAQLDEGQELHHLTPETQRDVEAYRAAMAAAGVTIMPEFVETTVVIDAYQVGGTFDRLVEVEGWPLPVIADLKTGADLSYSWPSFAVQLAAYSRANDLYDQGPAPDLDRRFTMPEVDQKRGIVIWLPAGSARCELHVVDLNAGWEGFELSMAVRTWRKRKGLSSPLDAASSSQWVPRVIEAAVDAIVEDNGHVAKVRTWLQERIDIIGRHPEARPDLVRLWPEGVPTLGASPDHDARQLDAIEHVLDYVEARHEMPFGTSKPDPQREADVLAALERFFPGSTITTGE